MRQMPLRREGCRRIPCRDARCADMGRAIKPVVLVNETTLDCSAFEPLCVTTLCLGPSNGLLIGGWRQSAQPGCSASRTSKSACMHLFCAIVLAVLVIQPGRSSACHSPHRFETKRPCKPAVEASPSRHSVYGVICIPSSRSCIEPCRATAKRGRGWSPAGVTALERTDR